MPPENSKNTSWKGAVAMCILMTFIAGFSAGFIIGDQRILRPQKDQELLDRGTVAGISYVLGRLDEDRDPAKAKEKFQDALKYNPSFQHAREALDRLLQKYDRKPDH